jgi:Fe-S cluster biogenesis protein NfuA
MILEDITIAVQRKLDGEIRPLLQFHGGDVRIEKITRDGVVHLEYFGACYGCFLQSATHYVTVRLRLLDVAGITDVVTRGVRLSEEAAHRIAEIYGAAR